MCRHHMLGTNYQRVAMKSSSILLSGAVFGPFLVILHCLLPSSPSPASIFNWLVPSFLLAIVSSATFDPILFSLPSCRAASAYSLLYRIFSQVHLRHSACAGTHMRSVNFQPCGEELVNFAIGALFCQNSLTLHLLALPCYLVPI